MSHKCNSGCHSLEVQIIISPLMLLHVANTGLPTKTAKMQTGVA